MIMDAYSFIKQWLLNKSITAWDDKKKCKYSGIVKSVGWKEGGKYPLRIYFTDGTECAISVFAQITDNLDENQPT